MEKAIYFVSDHHFGENPNEEKVRGQPQGLPLRLGQPIPSSNEGEKVRKFIEFMEYIKGCEALFIVGDFFDFYFEYKTQLPKAHFDILNALRRLKESGTRIYYIVGNHDFWVGDFFTHTLGIEVYKKPLELTLQNRKVFIAHGDELLGFDPLRWLLRNKLSIFLFYWIHPDIAQAIGRLVSKLSTKSRKVVKWERLYNIGRQKINLGFDTVIFGHIHTPKHIQIKAQIQQKSKEKDFLLLGDWIRHFTYGKLANGKFSLLKW